MEKANIDAYWKKTAIAAGSVLRGLFDIVLFHLLVQHASADAQKARGLRLVVPGKIDHTLDMLLLEIGYLNPLFLFEF